MRRNRLITLVAATFALSVAPVAAAADGGHGAGRPVVLPAGSAITSLYFETLFELPAAEHPFLGNGDPCVRLGRKGRVLSVNSPGATCTAERGTVLYIGHDHWCGTIDPPDSPFYAVGRAEQRRCAFAMSQSVTALTVTIDGRTTNLLKPRFATFSPTTVELPVGNIFEVEPGRYTLTSYGWEAIVTNLRVGRHEITFNGVDGESSGSYEHIVDSFRALTIIRPPLTS